MDKTTFLLSLGELGWSQADWAREVGEPVPTVKSRIQRGKIPDAWADLLRLKLDAKWSGAAVSADATGQTDAKPDASLGTDAPADAKPPTPDALTVLRPSADGCAEWDVMSDGYARGCPGDTKLMRAYYRTPGAYARILAKSRGQSVGVAPMPEMESLPRVYTLDAQGVPHAVVFDPANAAPEVTGTPVMVRGPQQSGR
jgi:hypothetical protein